MSVLSTVLQGLWGVSKKFLDQTDKQGKEGTLLGRTLASTVPHPLVQLLVPVLDPLLAVGIDWLVDPSKKTTIEVVFKEKLRDAITDNKDTIRAHYIGLLNFVFKQVDIPFVDGVTEEAIEEQIEKAVDNFILWQLAKV